MPYCWGSADFEQQLALAAEAERKIEDAPVRLSAGSRGRRTDCVDKLAFDSAALTKKLLKPMDVVIAVDDVLFAYQRAEQGKCGLDTIDHNFVEGALEPH